MAGNACLAGGVRPPSASPAAPSGRAAAVCSPSRICPAANATSMAGGMGQATIDAMLESQGAVGIVAEPMFRSYLVPFEITSLLLLVAIVGAIVLARRKAP